MLGRTYLAVRRRCIARIPGWDRECSESNTAPRKLAGTKGRDTPVEVSQTMVVSETASGTAWSVSVDGEDYRRMRSASSNCAMAIALKSMIWGELSTFSALASILDKAPAAALSVPLTCLMSDVNCEMKSRCRACRGECRSVEMQGRMSKVCGQ